MATKAIVGEKVGMTQVWDDQQPGRPGHGGASRAHARVVQVKTPETRGLLRPAGDLGHAGAGELTKPEPGHFDKAGVDPGRHLVELRLDDVSGYEVGQEI